MPKADGSMTPAEEAAWNLILHRWRTRLAKEGKASNPQAAASGMFLIAALGIEQVSGSAVLIETLEGMVEAVRSKMPEGAEDAALH